MTHKRNSDIVVPYGSRDILKSQISYGSDAVDKILVKKKDVAVRSL